MGIAVMNGRLFVVGGFSGKAFLESIEYLSEDAQEWCIYLPSGDKRHAGSSAGDVCECHQTVDSEGRSSSSSESEDVHNGKTVEENGKLVEENGKPVEANGQDYGGNAVQFNHVLSEDDDLVADCNVSANGENGHCKEISSLTTIQGFDKMMLPETSGLRESRFGVNGVASDCHSRLSETDDEDDGLI